MEGDKRSMAAAKDEMTYMKSIAEKEEKDKSTDM